MRYYVKSLSKAELLRKLYNRVVPSYDRHYISFEEAEQLLSENNNIITKIHRTPIPIDFNLVNGYLDLQNYMNIHASGRLVADITGIIGNMHKEARQTTERNKQKNNTTRTDGVPLLIDAISGRIDIGSLSKAHLLMGFYHQVAHNRLNVADAEQLLRDNKNNIKTINGVSINIDFGRADNSIDANSFEKAHALASGVAHTIIAAVRYEQTKAEIAALERNRHSKIQVNEKPPSLTDASKNFAQSDDCITRSVALSRWSLEKDEGTSSHGLFNINIFANNHSPSFSSSNDESSSDPSYDHS